MDRVSILCIAIGILALARGAAMIFAPSATLRLYDRWFLSTRTKFRAGAAIPMLGLALLIFLWVPAFNERSLHGFLYAVGWVAAILGLVMLIAPDVWRRFLSAIFNYFENSVDDVLLRILGLLVVVIGTALIYVGV